FSMPVRAAYMDSVPDTRTLPVPRTVADAERQGAAWPRFTAPSTQTPEAIAAAAGVSNVPLPAPRNCPAGADGMVLRSGDFQIGGQLNSAVVTSEPDRGNKIWWSPDHPARGLTLTVRGALLGGAAGDTVRFLSPDWAKSIPAGGLFYPSGFPFKKSGRWV